VNNDNNIMSANEAEVVEQVLTDNSVAYNVHWKNCIDSEIVIECCDKKSAERVVKALNDDAVGFDVIQS
jgi:hypothetical protein